MNQKAKKPKGKASTEKVDTIDKVAGDWYAHAKPTQEYLPKEGGLSTYLLLDEGYYKESLIDGRTVKSVEFMAEYYKLTDVGGKKSMQSPNEPQEGILSIPLSVAKKMRKFMEESQMKTAGLVGLFLRLQRTGAGIDTRYPHVELLEREAAAVD